MSSGEPARTPTTEELLELPIDTPARARRRDRRGARRCDGRPLRRRPRGRRAAAARRRRHAARGGADPADGRPRDPERAPGGARAGAARRAASARSCRCGCGTGRSRCSSSTGRAEGRSRSSRRARPSPSSSRCATPTASAARGTGSARPRAPSCSRSLLPPRIAGVRGAELAGTVLPAYDVGGDWFDHAADDDGAWLALADAAGKGGRASAVSALSLAAFRAARQADGSLVEAAALMDRRRRRLRRSVDVRDRARRALGRRRARRSSGSRCGHPLPCRLPPTARLEELAGAVFPPLGMLSDQPVRPGADRARARRSRRVLLRRRGRAAAPRTGAWGSRACSGTWGWSPVPPPRRS